MSTAFGVGTSFLIGSIVAAHFGWRAAFFVAGVPGMLLSLMVVTALREPRRGATEEGAATTGAVATAPTASETLRHISTNRPLICIAIAITLATLVWTGLWVWCSSILIRFHGFTLQEAGAAVAMAAIFQAAGSWLGGRFGDAGSKRFGTAGLGYVAAAAALCSVPFGFGFGFAASTPIALACMCATVLFFGAWQGPGFGMAMSVAHPRLRGSAASFIQLTCNLLGSGVGPFAMGVLSDAWDGDLRRALAMVLFANIGTALFFMLAAHFAKSAKGAGDSPDAAVGPSSASAMVH
jgi:predicted MFS family arabinose efflux permease